MTQSSVARYIINYLETMQANAAELVEIRAALDTMIAQAEHAEQPQAEHETYRQEYVRCGKEGCRKCSEGEGHGPYWYAYRREGGKLKKRYIGKQRPT